MALLWRYCEERLSGRGWDAVETRCFVLERLRRLVSGIVSWVIEVTRDAKKAKKRGEFIVDVLSHAVKSVVG